MQCTINERMVVVVVVVVLLHDGLKQRQARLHLLLRVARLHSGAHYRDVLPFRSHVVSGGDQTHIDICTHTHTHTSASAA